MRWWSGKKALRALVAANAVALLASLACRGAETPHADVPTPEQICTHAAELIKQEGREPSYDGYKSCVHESEKTRSENPTEYACTARCAMGAKTFVEMDRCRCR